jgi:hypothetical protein
MYIYKRDYIRTVVSAFGKQPEFVQPLTEMLAALSARTFQVCVRERAGGGGGLETGRDRIQGLTEMINSIINSVPHLHGPPSVLAKPAGVWVRGCLSKLIVRGHI